MNLYRHIETHEDGRARIPGVTFEGRPLRVHERIKRAAGDILILRVEGGKCWAGVGADREYVPAKFMVFDIFRESKRKTEKGWREWETGDLWFEFDVRAKR